MAKVVEDLASIPKVMGSNPSDSQKSSNVMVEKAIKSQWHIYAYANF